MIRYSGDDSLAPYSYILALKAEFAIFSQMEKFSVRVPYC